MHQAFLGWNRGELNSYLVELAADVLSVKDPDGDGWLLERISERTGAKGTGQRMVESALELGVPNTMAACAVQTRQLSELESLRVQMRNVLKRRPRRGIASHLTTDAIRQALHAAVIVNYSMNLLQLQIASRQYNWSLNVAGIVRVWRAGAIISGAILEPIAAAFDQKPDLDNLIVLPYFQNALEGAQTAWIKAVCEGLQATLPLPAMTTGLVSYLSARCDGLPTYLVTAMRDAFGRHGYFRHDKPGQGPFSTDWQALQQPRENGTFRGAETRVCSSAAEVTSNAAS